MPSYVPCGAKCKITPLAIETATAQGPEALVKLLKRTYCKNHPMKGKTRCRFHGGMSTGPKTIAGKIRVTANLPFNKALSA